MPKFTIPLMLTVEADSYDVAFSIADRLAEIMALVAGGEDVYAAYHDDTDNSGQRVYYLPPTHCSNEEWDVMDS